MTDFLSTLRQRGFIQQTTDDETDDKPLAAKLEAGPVTGYIGFDPTASSLHVGNLVCVMGLVHLQRAGHRPLVILGGGTGMVGDPSGKTEMRKVLADEQIAANLRAQREQFGRYLELRDAGGDEAAAPSGDDNVGLAVNNAEWLTTLGYIDFLREIGRHFSVNRMLAAESVKQRLDSEGGLSFLEFNYSLLQAYDFLMLYRRYGCTLQLGGADQWGNIVAGIDLVRRAEGSDARAHGVTFPLLTTSSGKKMGKTESGAVWLDAERTSPYDFYQYWINTDDRDVGRFLKIFTLLPLDEIARLEALEGADIREAKQVLAYEATTLTHGRDEAEKAKAGAKALFSKGGGDGASMPTFEIERQILEEGVLAVNVAAECGLCESRGAARRLAKQNGFYVNGESRGGDYSLTLDDLQDDEIRLRAGKKRYYRIVPKA